MAWVAVHNTIFGKKLRNLKKITDISELECIGALVALWLWGLDNANQEGEIENADEQDLVDVISTKTKSDPYEIISAIIDSKWIDKVDGKMYFHDWSTWQEQWYKALGKRERDREYQKGKKGGTGEVGRPADGERPTEKGYPPEFEELWKAYPRKINKDLAFKKYTARINEGWSHDDLMAATIAYCAYVKRQGTATEYIKHCATFFGPSRPFTDYLPKKEDAAEEDGGNPFRGASEEL